MTVHQYTLKLGAHAFSYSVLRTNSPLTAGMYFIDLYDGMEYQVREVYQANPHEKLDNGRPETIVHARVLEPLSGVALEALRRQAGYRRTDSSFPLEEIVLRRTLPTLQAPIPESKPPNPEHA